MNPKLIELLEELQKNENLYKEIEDLKSIEEIYAVTTKYVDGYTVDELKEGLAQL